jgi:cell wall-associated NlpC family hydrolase
VDVTSLTTEARAALATSPVVSVPADASWSFAAPAISVTANPKAKAVVQRTAAVASRSTERTSVAAAKVATSAIPQSVNGNAVLEIAARYVGVPYVSGGTTPDGFDCSGFTMYVYAQLGISLPHSSSEQRYAGVVVSRADAQPGDLIWSPGHVGIYAGGNMQIDAPRPGKTIQFRAIWQSSPIFIRVTG